jgi:hypothetical protein
MTQLAKRLKCSTKAVSMLLKAPEAPAPIGKGMWDLDAVRAFQSERRSLDKSKPTGTYAEALRAKTEAQRDLLKLELEVKRGNLIDKDTVEMQQRAFVQVVQSGVLNMHTTLAMLVAGKSQGECETEIKGYARRMIESWKKLAKKEAAN